MNIVSAELSEVGGERIVGLVSDPARLTQSVENFDIIAGNRWSTVWIPGITIPNVEFLDKPFAVQVQGDIEPFSTSITWRPGANECIEASFTGYLSASEVSKTGGEKNEYKLRKIRESFDNLSKFGGFLHTTVNLEEIEDDVDLENTNLIFGKGLLNVGDLCPKSSKSATFMQKRTSSSFLFNETADEHFQVLKLMTENGFTPNDVVAAIKFRDLSQNTVNLIPSSLQPVVVL
jgi:hypothetical protein